MTGRLSKNFHGVGIGPLSKILAVNKVLLQLPKVFEHIVRDVAIDHLEQDKTRNKSLREA